MTTKDEIDDATTKLDEIGGFAPIMDELKLGDSEPTERPIETDLTSDEESELPGTQRPRKGAGWWGRGPELRRAGSGAEASAAAGPGGSLADEWPLVLGAACVDDPGSLRGPTGKAA